MCAGEGSDPKLLSKCANFFIEHQQFSKACAMLVNAKDYDRALRMALDHQVQTPCADGLDSQNARLTLGVSAWWDVLLLVRSGGRATL
jgi:hypothetical protein